MDEKLRKERLEQVDIHFMNTWRTLNMHNVIEGVHTPTDLEYVLLRTNVTLQCSIDEYFRDSPEQREDFMEVLDAYKESVNQYIVQLSGKKDDNGMVKE